VAWPARIFTAAAIPDLVDAVGDVGEAVAVKTGVLELEGYTSEVLEGALEIIVLPLLHP
jgi:hypothetical protein